jgi:hypothetical protein
MAAGKAAIMIPLPGQLEQTERRSAEKGRRRAMIHQDELRASV